MGMRFSAPWRVAHTSIIVVGLDNAGKTTILKTIKEKNHNNVKGEVAPTVGVSRDYVQLRDHQLRLTTFDLSGHSRYRNMWEDALNNDVSGIVFVLDASDSIRFVVARDELESLLKTPACLSKRTPLPILFLANKMDLPSAASTVACSQALGLHQNLSHGGPWHISATNALTEKDSTMVSVGWLINSGE